MCITHNFKILTFENSYSTKNFMVFLISPISQQGISYKTSPQWESPVEHVHIASEIAGGMYYWFCFSMVYCSLPSRAEPGGTLVVTV